MNKPPIESSPDPAGLWRAGAFDLEQPRPFATDAWRAVLAIALISAGAVPAHAQAVQTARYDFPGSELSTAGNELYLDYLFPPLPAEIVKTRFHLTYEVDDAAGFDAALMGFVFQPPIDDPNADDDRVLTVYRTGEDFGWSGTGTFTFVGETDELNGQVLEAPPGASAMLYGLGLFHAARLTDPDNILPIAGRFASSYIEVDYVLIPEPSAGSLLIVAVTLLTCISARRASA
jgi:hypothetical protein